MKRKVMRKMGLICTKLSLCVLFSVGAACVSARTTGDDVCVAKAPGYGVDEHGETVYSPVAEYRFEGENALYLLGHEGIVVDEYRTDKVQQSIIPVQQGSEVRVSGVSDTGWLRLTLADGREGYMSAESDMKLMEDCYEPVSETMYAAQNLIVFSSAREDDAKRIGSVSKNEALHVIGRNKDEKMVRIDWGGAIGYVKADVLKEQEDSVVKKASVIKECSLLEKAQDESNKLGTLKEGEEVTVLEDCGNYFKIKSKNLDKSGYVNIRYLDY